jgi:hypothetical protein
MKSKPHIPRGTKLVSVHTKMLKKVNKIFARQPSDPKRGGLGPLGPLRPSRYFGLPMIDLSQPPLPPNKPYRRPFNYPEYVKDSNPNVHVKVFKATIRTNGKIEDVKIVNLFSFTLDTLCLIGVIITWETT